LVSFLFFATLRWQVLYKLCYRCWCSINCFYNIVSQRARVFTSNIKHDYIFSLSFSCYIKMTSTVLNLLQLLVFNKLFPYHNKLKDFWVNFKYKIALDFLCISLLFSCYIKTISVQPTLLLLMVLNNSSIKHSKLYGTSVYLKYKIALHFCFVYLCYFLLRERERERALGWQ
jgi:hypothetical protein